MVCIVCLFVESAKLLLKFDTNYEKTISYYQNN